MHVNIIPFMFASVSHVYQSLLFLSKLHLKVDPILIMFFIIFMLNFITFQFKFLIISKGL